MRTLERNASQTFLVGIGSVDVDPDGGPIDRWSARSATIFAIASSLLVWGGLAFAFVNLG